MTILSIVLILTGGFMARAETTAFEKDCAKLQSQAADSTRLKKLLDLHWKYTMVEYPEYATEIGFPGQNRRWTDRSLQAIQRRQKELDAPLKVLKSIKRSALSEAEKLNFDLFKRSLETSKEGAQFPEELLPLSQMFGAHSEISRVIALMPRDSSSDYEDILVRMKLVPKVLEQVQALLEEGSRKKVTYPKVAMEKVAAQLDGLQEPDPAKNPLLEPFQEFPAKISKKDKDRLSGQAADILKNVLIPAFAKLGGYFRSSYLPSCRSEVGWSAMPSHQKWYQHKIRQQTTTTLSAEEIHKIGLGEVARILKEMEAIRVKVGFKGSLEQFNDFLRTDSQFFYTKEEDLIAGYRELGKRIDPGLPGLFGKLPRLTYGVEPIPAFSAPSQPTAYYQGGSPVSGRAGIFFANTYDLKSRPKWEMEALTLHEAVPGHHLQVAIAQELENVPEFRKYEGYNAYQEGWALYSEGLGADLGLYKDPYSEFGKLTYEMWRSIRLVVDTGLHTMGWSRERAIEYFTQNAGKAGSDIAQEVDRYMVMPAQALGYKIGHLKILEIRKKMEKKLGKKFSVRAFHDAVLENGALPLDVLEERMDRWAKSVK